jgi:hypothetical protein
LWQAACVYSAKPLSQVACPGSPVHDTERLAAAREEGACTNTMPWVSKPPPPNRVLFPARTGNSRPPSLSGASLSGVFLEPCAMLVHFELYPSVVFVAVLGLWRSALPSVASLSRNHDHKRGGPRSTNATREVESPTGLPHFWAVGLLDFPALESARKPHRTRLQRRRR